jgi:hypothetical protein
MGVLEDAEGHGRITALRRDQLGRIVGGEFLQEEKVGGGDGIAQELDALTNERGDGEELFWLGI